MEYDALEKNLETREILQEIVRVFPGFEKVHDIESVKIVVSMKETYLRKK